MSDFYTSDKCPVCLCDDIFDVYRFRNGNVYAVCKKCGHVFARNVVSETDSLGKNYKQYYPDVFLLDRNNIFFKIAEFRKKEIESILAPNYVKSILEIGSGYGHFLSMFLNDGVFTAGIEPSKEEHDFARKYFKISHIVNCGFEEISGKIDSWPVNEFDVVASFHVIEHILHINKFMTFIKRFSAKESTVFIATPNVLTLKPNFIDWFFLRKGLHLHIFNPVSLEILLDRYGFKLKKSAEEPLSLSGSSFYVIAERYLNGLHDDSKKQEKKKAEKDRYDILDLNIIKKRLSEFFDSTEEAIIKIKDFINEVLRKGKTIAFYGAGIHTLSILTALRDKDVNISSGIKYIIDDDPAKLGTSVMGIPVVDSGNLNVDFVLVSSLASEKKILSKLESSNNRNKDMFMGIYRDFFTNIY